MGWCVDFLDLLGYITLSDSFYSKLHPDVFWYFRLWKTPTRVNVIENSVSVFTPGQGKQKFCLTTLKVCIFIFIALEIFFFFLNVHMDSFQNECGENPKIQKQYPCTCGSSLISWFSRSDTNQAWVLNSPLFSKGKLQLSPTNAWLTIFNSYLFTQAQVDLDSFFPP